MMRPQLIAVMGPTASGKSELAESLAQLLNADLINADIFQAYRHFNIGTAKPSNPDVYHLINTLEPWESTTAGEWCTEARDHLRELFSAKKSAIIVGGTGFYIRALFEEYAEMSNPEPKVRQTVREIEAKFGLDGMIEQLEKIAPNIAKSVDLKNPMRVRRALEKSLTPTSVRDASLPDFAKSKFILNPDVEELDDRIYRRVEAMLVAGWLEETRNLYAKFPDTEMPAYRAIGYKILIEHLNGVLSLDESIARIAVETRQYAKRQRTWLRSEPNAIRMNCFGDREDATDFAISKINLITE